ncbi:MAG: DUF58 domain-containing protein [Cyclobacteriaceae bacterium]|nr:DUF58 domain-containing protein [Cyclobacteriaceae bacterium]MCX7637444.1 DUF58 domain-containing protein [Cyclobacteriaceae bacterium]MDW8330169.1 DUF58 domain-containing protein [Cyclobacteriaceae bacterium]
MKELLKKLRSYEIRIRKAINSHMQGDFRSVFKGTGLEFDDVRPYQYGDDIRAIDWNVTAKGHGTFIKTFREEKEQTVYFIVDVSASQNIGSVQQTKLNLSTEICGVLALSAVKESSHVGLICFSDQRELYLKPAKGLTQAYRMIQAMTNLKPQSKKTSLNKAITFALSTINRRSVIILISDFIDDDYEVKLKALARKHDLVCIRVADEREKKLPPLGIIPVFDAETQTLHWVNTSFGKFPARLKELYEQRSNALSVFCRKNQINFITVQTGEDFVPLLLQLFKTRNRTVKKT